MANERRCKVGLDYWPFDCDFFSDIKIKKLSKNQGGKATLVYIYLLGRIYRERGYYLLWDSELPFIVSYDLGAGYEEGYVLEVIKACLMIGLFDEELFKAENVLTSAAIQNRYSEICSNLRRRCNIDKYNLIDTPLPLDDANNSLNVAINPLNVAIKDQNVTFMQTIERNRIEENRIEVKKESIPIGIPKKECDSENAAQVQPPQPKSLEQRKHDFGVSLIPFIDKYGKEMIRDFFDYWTEVNEGGNKMAWEKAMMRKGTFNIAKRLSTWKRNADNGYGSSYGGRKSQGKGISISDAVKASYIPEGSLESIDMTKLLGD